MITKRMTAKEARDNFTDLLGAVYYGKEPVIVEKKGRPFAVVLSPEEYQQYENFKSAARKRVWEIVEEIQSKNKNASFSKVLEDVTAEVEKVRTERYAKDQQNEDSN